MKKIAFLALAVMLTGCASNNPVYNAWANFKPGATVTLRADMEGSKVYTTSVQTLTAVTADKITIEKSSTVTNGAEVTKYPMRKVEIPAKINAADLGRAVIGEDVNKPVDKGTLVAAPLVSHETLDVAGGSRVATLYDVAVQTGSATDAYRSRYKFWYADSIPGGVAHAVMTAESPAKLTFTITLVEFRP